MRKYELSISADYVPSWGIVEAVRELFQNAIDEETRDSSNKMVMRYDEGSGVLIIGNKHSELDIKTLLFGNTSKCGQEGMIGQHGEGYKIATTVLLRNEKEVTFYNYCRKEIWRPRLVKSRKYDGMLVPTFFVETTAMWEKVPEHSLIIEIKGITKEEYEDIRESNLHLRDCEKIETHYGNILTEKKFAGKIYVGGLYICSEPKLEVGLDFKPRFVRLERDRSMVNNFDIQWYAARMMEESENKALIKKSLNSYSGYYIKEYAIPDELKNEITEDFINEYGAKAVPVSNQKDLESMKKRGYKPVIVSDSKKEVILSSELFRDVAEENKRIKERQRPLYDRFCEFIESIEERLTEDEIVKMYEFLDEIKENEEEKDGE